MEANPGPPRGRAGAGFDRDMQDFLINMEVAAKTIIKVRMPPHHPPATGRYSASFTLALCVHDVQRDTKRRMAEAKRVSQMQLLMAASGSTVRMDDSNSSPSRKRRLKEAGGHGSVVVVNPTLAPLNPAANMGPMTFDRRAMSVSVSKIPSDQKVLHMTHSGPSTTMAATTLLHADAGTQLDKTRGIMPQGNTDHTRTASWRMKLRASRKAIEGPCMPLRRSLPPTDPSLATDLAPSFPPPLCAGKPSTPPAHGAQASQSSPLPPLRRSAQIKQQMRAMALQNQEKDNLHPTLFANPLYKAPAQVKTRRRQVGTDAQLFAGKRRGRRLSVSGEGGEGGILCGEVGIRRG